MAYRNSNNNMSELKNRLETLIEIHNRILNARISNEVDVALFNREILLPSISEQEVKNRKQQLQATQAQITLYDRILGIVKEFIKTELDKKDIEGGGRN